MRIEWTARRKLTVVLLLLVALAVAVDHFRVRFRVNPARIETCEHVGVEVDVAWMVIGTRSVKLFVYGVGEKPKLWLVGGWRGKARTGAWVSDGMTVMLTDSAGRTVAKKTIEAVACPP
ncbi:hypothetical protein [Luteibacter jiangsuensis]